MNNLIRSSLEKLIEAHNICMESNEENMEHDGQFAFLSKLAEEIYYLADTIKGNAYLCLNLDEAREVRSYLSDELRVITFLTERNENTRKETEND